MAADPAADTSPEATPVTGRQATARPAWRVAAGAVGVGGAVFVVAQAAAGLGNVGFHVVISRLLGPADYGALGSLLAIVTVVSVPATAVETLITARVAAQLQRGEPVAAGVMVRRALATGAATAGLLVVAAPAIAGWLALGSTLPAVWLALYCLPLSASVMGWGLLCGQRRFAPAGGIALAGAAARIGLAVGFVELGFGVAGALAASVCAESLRAALLIAAARVRALDGPGARPVPLPGRLILGSTFAFAGFWLLIGADTVLARRLFSPVVAGQYAAAATASRAALLFAQAICLVAVPVFATADERGALRALRQTLAVTAACGSLVTVALGALGPRVLPWVFGTGFGAPAGLLALLGTAAAGLALLWVLVQFHLARTGRGAVAAWVGFALVAGGVLAGGVGPRRLALVMIVAAGVSVALAGRVLVRSDLAPDHPPGPSARPRDEVDLTVVVPYHNPGGLLRPTLEKLLTALRGSGVRFEVIAVADGCTDGSPATIADLDRTLVRHLALRSNRGKGAALRLGLREGRGRHVGFIDADGDLDPHDLQPFLALLRLYDPDAVIGSKYHPLSHVDPAQCWRRRVCSVGYRCLVRLLFPTLRVSDTQVGIKVFRWELLADVLPHTVERGFVFDLELLAVAHRRGHRRLLPAPVTIRPQGISTVRAGTVWRMLADTVALAWRVYAGGYERGRPAAVAGHDDLAAAPVRTAPARLTEV